MNLELLRHLENKTFEKDNENGKTSGNRPNSLRAAIYAAREVQGQQQCFMPEFETCAKYIQQKGWIFCDLYVERKHIATGSSNSALLLMLERAKSGCFEVLVVSNLSLLSWSSLTFDKVSSLLYENNVALYLATKPIGIHRSKRTINLEKKVTNLNNQVTLTWYQYEPFGICNDR